MITITHRQELVKQDVYIITPPARLHFDLESFHVPTVRGDHIWHFEQENAQLDFYSWVALMQGLNTPVEMYANSTDEWLLATFETTNFGNRIMINKALALKIRREGKLRA